MTIIGIKWTAETKKEQQSMKQAKRKKPPSITCYNRSPSIAKLKPPISMGFYFIYIQIYAAMHAVFKLETVFYFLVLPSLDKACSVFGYVYI